MFLSAGAVVISTVTGPLVIGVGGYAHHLGDYFQRGCAWFHEIQPFGRLLCETGIIDCDASAGLGL